MKRICWVILVFVKASLIKSTIYKLLEDIQAGLWGPCNILPSSIMRRPRDNQPFFQPWPDSGHFSTARSKLQNSLKRSIAPVVQIFSLTSTSVTAIFELQLTAYDVSRTSTALSCGCRIICDRYQKLERTFERHSWVDVGVGGGSLYFRLRHVHRVLRFLQAEFSIWKPILWTCSLFHDVPISA